MKGIRCRNCQEIIVSKHRHDFVWCGCGMTFVDGGREYLRYGCDGELGEPEIVEVNEDAGYLDENHFIPCTCKPGCGSVCKGGCGCEACQLAYSDFLSCE